MHEYPPNFYSVAKITWLKINAKRMAFYDGILTYSNKSTIVSKETLYAIGQNAGLNQGLVDDEIILCQYSNFLMLEMEENHYFITKQAQSDLLIYQKETRFKHHEIPITFDFAKNYTKITVDITDTISSILINELKRVFGFSINYSNTYISKKFISHAKLLAFLDRIMEYLEVNENDVLTLEKLIRIYGKVKTIFSEKSCQINHRGWSYSETLIRYKDIYSDLLKIAIRPTDWCGKSFSRCEVDAITKIHEIDVDEFLKLAVTDGMIRFCEDNSDNYTITGQAHTTINALLNQEEKSRLVVIMRPSHIIGRFNLWIGDNSLYHKDFYHAFSENQYEYDSGWYVIKGLDHQAFIQQLDRLFSFFKISSGLGVQKLHC